MDALTAKNSVLAPFRRITVKIGSALLIDSASGNLRQPWFDSLCDDLAALAKSGHEIIIVSSGAIALGRRRLGLDKKDLTLEESQAAASVGQIALSEAWSLGLARHGITTGQILITPNITEERRYYLNARTTIKTLLGLGAVPIINENDSVATAEIRYGDNDRLSARVATMVEADLLVLLSDVDGLYSAPPAIDPDAVHIPHVPEVTARIEAMAGGAASHLSRGGMQTKIEAAKLATKAGTAMIIAKGTNANPLRMLAEGGRHTSFAADQSPSAARKRWIMGSLAVAGTLIVDDGAARALGSGKSLLPIGVTDIKGDFSRGDAVAIVTAAGVEIGRGLAALDSEDAKKVKGLKSADMVALIGPDARKELVHRDNLVLVAPKGKGSS